MKKVLHVFFEINFSGAEIMYLNAAPVFRQRGFETIALSTGNKEGDFADQFRSAGIRVLQRPFVRSWKNIPGSFGYFRNFYKLLKEERIDVLHIHRSHLYWYYALCARVAGIRTIRTVHNVFRNRKATWPKAWLDRLTARKLLDVRFQAISPSVYANELNYYHNPSTQINNWFDASKFFPATQHEKAAMRENLGIEPNGFVIVSAGSCTHVKNHSDILRAVSMITATPDTLTYLHLGTGPLEMSEINEAKSLGIEKKVKFFGNRVNVRDFYIASDVFVMTSKFEGLGNSAVEAMACGLPVVLYDVPGLNDLIDHDDNGYLIQSNPVQLAESLKKLSRNESMTKEKGKSAEQFVNKYFDMNNAVSQMITLYTT